MAAEAGDTFGAVHILVNNAAVFILRGIDATVEEWRQTLDVNVMGPSLVAKHVVPAIRKARRRDREPRLDLVVRRRAELRHLQHDQGRDHRDDPIMAMDLAPDNIRVNAVCPGVVWTQIVEKQAIAMGLDRAGADVHPQWAGAQLIHRSRPREIAYAILFLASDEASFITGTPLMVDAGYTAR